MKHLYPFFFCHICMLIGGCSKNTNPEKDSSIYPSKPEKIVLEKNLLNEASGIADSQKNPGYLWVEQDGGNPTEISLLGHNGKLKKNIFLAGIENHDWEDLLLGPGPESGKNYIYLADIGDNNGIYLTHTIYRFEEPSLSEDTLSQIDLLQFSYPDHPHDAEAILIDPIRLDLYVITKNDPYSLVFKIPYPQVPGINSLAVLVGELPYNKVVSAATDPGGEGIVIKTYDKIYFYPSSQTNSPKELLNRPYTELPYEIEPQGEAICFNLQVPGYFTLSESIAGSHTLNFYRKK